MFQAQSLLIVETTWPWSSCSRLRRCCRLPVLSMAMKPIVTLPERDGNQVAMLQISQVSESVASKYVHSKPSFANSAEYKSHNDEATSSRLTLRNYRPCNTLWICLANTSPPKLGANTTMLQISSQKVLLHNSRPMPMRIELGIRADRWCLHTRSGAPG